MAQQVAPPQRRPRAGGIKSIVDAFINEPRLSVVNAAGGIAWEDAGCGLPSTTRAGCYDGVVPAADKVGTGPTQYTSIIPPFAQYKGVECYIGGDSDGSYIDQAKAILEAGEERGVELRLYTWSKGGPAATTNSLDNAIATVDEHADANYVGLPIIIMSRFDADLAHQSGVLKREDDGRLVTGNGTPVISTSAADNGTISIIGWPAVVAAVGMNRAENIELAIAERVYAIGVDCNYRYAVTATSN
jgi:hypothetical protein